MSTAKKHLTIDFDFDAELDFVLIGISCPLKDYRLCHFISKYSSIDFVRGKEDYVDHKGYAKDKAKEEMDFHIIYEKSKRKEVSQHYFSIYRCCGENFEFEYYLLNNRSSEGILLLHELPNFDYFLLIKHYIDEEDLRSLLIDIKSIQEVVLVKELNPATLKSKENLIF